MHAFETGRYIIDGHACAVRTYGHGRHDVLIVPGICAGITSYAALAERVMRAGDYRVFVIEMPGSGMASTDDMSLRYLTRFLSVFIRELRLRPGFTLVGHSRGGTVAMAAVTTDKTIHPGSLALINPKTEALKIGGRAAGPILAAMSGSGTRETFRFFSTVHHTMFELNGVLNGRPELEEVENHSGSLRGLSRRARARVFTSMTSGLLDLLSNTAEMDAEVLSGVLRQWRVPLSMHVGALDSLTPAGANMKFARCAGADETSIFEYRDIGHMLGCAVPDTLASNLAAMIKAHQVLPPWWTTGYAGIALEYQDSGNAFDLPVLHQAGDHSFDHTFGRSDS